MHGDRIAILHKPLGTPIIELRVLTANLDSGEIVRRWRTQEALRKITQLLHVTRGVQESVQSESAAINALESHLCKARAGGDYRSPELGKALFHALGHRFSSRAILTSFEFAFHHSSEFLCQVVDFSSSTGTKNRCGEFAFRALG
jgi:hypothetical protein